MSPFEIFLAGRFMVFTLVLARISGLMLAAPIFSSLGMPRQIKALLAVAMALLVTPVYLNTSLPPVANVVSYGHLMVNEVLVGLLLGVGMNILFSGVQAAGQIASQMSGISLSDVFNPGFDENISVFSQLFYYVTIAVFVAIGGHRMMTEALLDTFAWAPPGHAMLGDTFVTTLTELMTQSFVLGIRAAAPLLIALSLSTLVLGLVSRTLPQLNIIAIGFGFNSLLMLGMTAVSLGAAAWTFQEPAIDALERLQETLPF
jgi:flagellar biosynthetic protein FliR